MKDEAEHSANLKEFFERCHQIGIKLNRKKLEVGLKEISFMGHKVTSNGLKVDPEKVKGITSMTRPKNLAELRRFMGMLNYMSKFLPKLAEVMQPLHNFLKKEVPYNWSQNEERAFNKVKEMLLVGPVLAFYDPKKRVDIRKRCH